MWTCSWSRDSILKVKQIFKKICLRKCNSTGDQDCDQMKDCIEQDNTKAVMQYVNKTNGHTTGMTKIFKVNYV